ncbi:11578_t:CDS:2 [Paraglomus brasilianum]|uniref:11578_t:CDS:1 n=1 Tax=Paraglomus brasilianum TaxID=144538 RepID=A0A9N8ZR78_9GLOM|nr:11578_t:CDS:2 [Paraglomus brasilianum]
MAEEEETLYEYFWDLASLDSYIRQKTAKALITHLDECFRNHGKLVTIPDKLSTNCEDFITASEVIEQYYGPDIAYSLIRLTRGLPSPREGARHGFALALTELLSNLQTITVDLVIIFIDDACPFTSTKEQEDPNNLIGRVLGYMSIIRSGILWRTNATIKDYKTIIDGLVKCSECKSYIKEICYHVMIGSLSQLKKTKYEKDALKYLIEQVLDNAGQGIQNSDTLNLALAIQEQYPDIHKNSDWKDLVIDKAPDSLVRWENPFILHHDNMSKIAECLQARPKQDSSDDQNQESQFHSVWNRILSVYINNKTPSSKQKGAKNKIVPFSTFWKEIVDNGLFATESTHKRRFWGFQFFEKCLLSLSKEHVESLFTSNFMRSLTNHLVDESRYLHEAAARTFEVICQRAKEDNEIVIVLIKELVGKDESRNFDDFTKGNNLKKLTSCLDSQGLITYLNYLKSIVLNQDIPSTASFDKYRRWTIDQMYGLVRNTTSERKEELVKSILGLYIASGFFRVKEIVEDNPKRKRTNTSRKSSKKVKLNTGEGAEADQEKSEEFILEYVSAKPELSQSIRELLRKRLFNVLGELNKIKPSNSENVKNDSTTSNGNAWAYYALKQVLKLENDSRFELLISLDEETQRVKQTAVDCIETIEKQIKKPSKNSTQNVLSQYIAFEWLFSHTALWLFAEPLEAKSILEDLQVCYQKVFKQSKRPRRRKKGDDDMEEDPEPIDVLVDILLGFLGKPSVLLRHLTEQVFEVFCDQMTKTALDLLLSVRNNIPAAVTFSLEGFEDLY